MEKAWKMFDTAQDEVKKHKEVILSLQQELKNSKMNEQHAGKSEGPGDRWARCVEVAGVYHKVKSTV